MFVKLVMSDTMDSDDAPDTKELLTTLETYRKLADDFTNHDTILKVRVYYHRIIT